jgi:hypothetical protein
MKDGPPEFWQLHLTSSSRAKPFFCETERHAAMGDSFGPLAQTRVFGMTP